MTQAEKDAIAEQEKIAGELAGKTITAALVISEGMRLDFSDGTHLLIGAREDVWWEWTTSQQVADHARYWEIRNRLHGNRHAATVEERRFMRWYECHDLPTWEEQKHVDFDQYGKRL